MALNIQDGAEAGQHAIEPHILERKPFDPNKHLGNVWSFVEQISKRSGGSLDAGKIVGKDYLQEGESTISGEERLKRIKATPADIQLDAEDFLALYEEKDQLTLRWLYESQGITWLSFWGTILGSTLSDGNVLCVLCLYHSGDGSWFWGYGRVGDLDWVVGGLSAVLAS
ncbi:MAG: hypothetical protein AAB515_04315 [Patescibacteria group bacterium]